MNLRDPKTQILIIIVVIFLAVYYFWYTKIFTPFEARIEAQEARRNTLLTELHQVQQRAATLEELEKEFNDLQLKYRRVELLLPERREDESFLSQLHAAAQLTGSVVINIAPLGTESSDFYETNSYTVEVKSSYHGLGKFLAKVANFPFIVNLSDINLKSPTTSLMMMTTEREKSDKVTKATFKLSTYNIKQGSSG